MAGITIGTKIYTWLRGEEVGRDTAGNRYFREKGGGRVHRDSLRHERRWVIYDGEVEASRVPPEWHAWLHHTSDEIPPPEGPARYPWQKEARSPWGWPSVESSQSSTAKTFGSLGWTIMLPIR